MSKYTEVADRAISHALKLGAPYADVRLESTHWESILVKDRKVERVSSGKRHGLGIRVLSNTWGFASSTDISRTALKSAVEAAFGMSKAVKMGVKLNLPSRKAKKARVRTKVFRDPFGIPIEDRIKLCLESDKLARVDKFIKRTSAWLSSEKVEKVFLSTEGDNIVFQNVLTYGGTFALAKRGAVVEYMDELGGGSGGFEIIQQFDMHGKAIEVGRRASALAASKSVPEKRTKVVLDQDFVALLCHEIIGHPSEADRVIGKEAAWAGKTWWAGMIGERVGSNLLNATDDPKIPGALGYYEYDDEGTPAKRKKLIRDGILAEHMHSRETAAEFGVEPNGNMRASGFEFVPLIRMSNSFIEPGNFQKDELFDLKEGVYLKGGKVPSIDSMRYNFQISAKEAFLISMGELEGPFRAASLRGVAPEFFESIDAVADDFEMKPIPNCGKGDPMQTLYVGNGGPHIRGVGIVSGAR